MPKRILLVTGDGGEAYEVLYAKHRFLEAGYTPIIAAPSRKRLNLVIHDFAPGWDTYIEKPGYLVESDTNFEKLQAANFIAVMILGGRAPEYLRNDRKLIALVQEFAKQNKPIFAVCHGIQVLVAARLVKNRDVTCYEHVKNEVLMGGGTWIGDESVRDGKFVTAQTWQSHPEFYRDVFSVLSGEKGN